MWDGLLAIQLTYKSLEERVRELGLVGQRLDRALLHAQQRDAEFRAQHPQQARPLGDYLRTRVRNSLTDNAKAIALGFIVPDGTVASRLMHVTGVHEILRHLRDLGPSPIWSALHLPDQTDDADVIGSAASYRVLQKYAADEFMELGLPVAQSQHRSWRRGKVRRKRDTANRGYLPKRLWGVGQWFDGSETMPDHVIAIDPGARSLLTARSFVRSDVDGVSITTSNKATLTAASSRRTRKRNVRNLQSIRAETCPEPAEIEHLRRIDRVGSSRYAVRASRNAKQQQRFDGAICRGLLSLLKRPTLRRHNDKLFVDNAEREDADSPGPEAEVMVLVGAACSKSTAEAQGLVVKLHQCFPRWKIRWVDEHLTSQLFVEAHSIRESPCLTFTFRKVLRLILFFSVYRDWS